MNNNINEKLQTLFAEYADSLPKKIQHIQIQWRNLLSNWDTESFKNFHRNIHNLCGSAGTYGFGELGKAARHLEVYLFSLLNKTSLLEEEKQKIQEFLKILEEKSKQSFPEKITLDVFSHNPLFENNLVYLLDKAPSLQELETNLSESGHSILTFEDYTSLKTAILHKKPFALIVNVDLIQEDTVSSLQKIVKETSILLISIASKGDILTRLKGVHLGGSAFFQIPIEHTALIKKLDQLCGIYPIIPYRILIIDDSPSLAEYYAILLKEAGMITHYITNPLLVMETITSFQPDLLLMDIYMPQCTGLDLACVLRQEPEYTSLPIIFLSTEDDRLKQLSALNLGGDDFLVKPIVPQHLIKAVTSRAKRAEVLSSLITTDSLTGLLNHAHILRRLEAEISALHKKEDSLAFIMIDIDNFKNINDTYGHPAGDIVIKKLANLLTQSFRKTDIVGRYGGEEFAVGLINTSEENALRLCNQLRIKFSQYRFKMKKKNISSSENSEFKEQALQNPLTETEFSVTLSAGVALFPMIKNENALIVAADTALYVAKNRGRNQIVLFDPSSMCTSYVR